MEIPENFNFYGPKNVSKLVKKLNKDSRKLKRNCETLSKVKCVQISYKKCLICPVIGNVHYREVRSRG